VASITSDFLPLRSKLLSFNGGLRKSLIETHTSQQSHLSGEKEEHVIDSSAACDNEAFNSVSSLKRWKFANGDIRSLKNDIMATPPNSTSDLEYLHTPESERSDRKALSFQGMENIVIPLWYGCN
jgi:hypothetical protein